MIDKRVLNMMKRALKSAYEHVKKKIVIRIKFEIEDLTIRFCKSREKLSKFSVAGQKL